MSYTSFADVYDSLTKNADYPARAEYIVSLLSDFGINNGLLLDLACGTGSLSVELSKRGFEVIGTDASPDMLTKAQNKAYEAGERIMFLCQRMEETDLYGTVRAIVCSLDSLNHLNDIALVEKTLKKLYNFIDTDGVMVFDVNTMYKHREILKDNTFIYDEKDVYCVWQNKLLENNKTVKINLDFFVRSGDGYTRSSERFCETAYTEAEIKTAVENAGFKILGRYGEFTHLEPIDNTQRAFYIIGRAK